MAGDRSTPGVTSQQLEARARALLHLSERLHHRQLQAWMWHCVYTLFNELVQHVLRRACMLTQRVLRLHADRSPSQARAARSIVRRRLLAQKDRKLSETSSSAARYR
jgi:hypothetical protein